MRLAVSGRGRLRDCERRVHERALITPSISATFAHRGAHLGCEENTWAAFAKAVQLGYRYIETDVQTTRDGVPVLFHDDTLSRVLGISGGVSDYTWSELAQMRTPAGEPLLRLEDALTDLRAYFPSLFALAAVAGIAGSFPTQHCNCRAMAASDLRSTLPTAVSGSAPMT